MNYHFNQNNLTNNFLLFYNMEGFMRKILLVFMLIFLSIFFYGCNKKTSNNNLAYLISIDIEALSNKNILNIINDESLQEGIYEIITDENKYIFFNGLNKEFIDISSSIEDKVFIIKLSTNSSSRNSKKLYLIKENNTTSSRDKSIIYDKIKILVDDNEVSFKNIFKLTK